MTNTVYIMVGLPGIGKSSFSKGKFRISSDDYIENAAKEASLTYDQIFKDAAKDADKWAKAQYEEALYRKEAEIYIDRTNMNEKSRAYWISRASNAQHYKIVCINFLSPSTKEETENLLKRSKRPGKTILEFVFTNMMNSYKKPTLAEGFDEIIEIPFRMF